MDGIVLDVTVQAMLLQNVVMVLVMVMRHMIHVQKIVMLQVSVMLAM